MKNKILIILVLILTIAIFSCKSRTDKTAKKYIVFSFKPYTYVMKEFGVENYKIDVLFKNSKDFDKKSLSSSQMKKIKKADLVVLNGYIEEPFTEQLKPYQSKIVYVSQMINQVKLDTDKKNPWYWLNQDLYMDYVRGINAQLGMINPFYQELHNQKTLELIDKNSAILSSIINKKVSDKAKFDPELTFLKEYFTDHQLISNQSKINISKSVGSSKKSDIQVDLWGEDDYSDMFEYFNHLYNQILTNQASGL